MPIYSPKSVIPADILAGDVARILSPDVETASTFEINIIAGGGGAAQNIHFVTERWTINSDNWESGGTMSCKLRVVAASNMRARCMIRRFSESGSVLQTGTFTTFQTISGGGIFTFDVTVPTWTTAQEACSNRLGIRFGIDKVISGTAGSATIEVGTVDSEITSTITENNGNCRRIFVS